MSSVNKVILVGHLGRDPENRTFPSGDMVANVSIATTDKWKDKQTGEPKEATEWHRLVFNGRLAEIASQYLRKGSQIYVEGQIRTRKYQDSNNVEKQITEIRVDQMQMLGSPPEDRNDRGDRGDRGGRQDDGGYNDRDNRGGGRQEQRRDDRGGDNRDSGRSNDRGGYQQQRGRDGGYGHQDSRGSGHDPRRGDPAPTGRGPAPAPAARSQAPAPAQQRGGDSGFDDLSDDIPF